MGRSACSLWMIGMLALYQCMNSLSSYFIFYHFSKISFKYFWCHGKMTWDDWISFWGFEHTKYSFLIELFLHIQVLYRSENMIHNSYHYLCRLLAAKYRPHGVYKDARSILVIHNLAHQVSVSCISDS